MSANGPGREPTTADMIIVAVVAVLVVSALIWWPR